RLPGPRGRADLLQEARQSHHVRHPLSVTAGLAVSKEFMVAKIEGKFDVNLSFKLTAKLGNNIAVDTPPKKTTNAKYGVYRLKHTGKSYKIYSNCTTSAKKTITSYSPYRVGWYLWES
ncbi:hypothetical protein, partial [Streptomyces thermocarboxydovorans]|uniref:hypothetical protein n=1 Tax=Streptomyces thermocarboxydovorans TaxID=59298 RepID=UPI0031E0D164